MFLSGCGGGPDAGAGFPAPWRLAHGVDAVYLFGATVAGGGFYDLGLSIYDLSAGPSGSRFVLAEGELLAIHVISFLVGMTPVYVNPVYMSTRFAKLF